MIEINPEEISEKDNYKLLIGSIIPRPIAFVTTISEEGVVNAAPFSFFNIVTNSPPMIGISIQRKKGLMKDTSFNIMNLEEFVVHIVDEDNVENVNEAARNLDHNESELAYTGLSLVNSTKIRVPGIKEAKVRFECRLEQIIPLGKDSDGNISTDLVIGRIVTYHIDDEVYEDGKINPRKLNATARLAGASYAKIGEIFEIERPN